MTKCSPAAPRSEDFETMEACPSWRAFMVWVTDLVGPTEPTVINVIRLHHANAG